MVLTDRQNETWTVHFWHGPGQSPAHKAHELRRAQLWIAYFARVGFAPYRRAAA